MKYAAWMNSANSDSEEFGVTLLVKKLESGLKKKKKKMTFAEPEREGVPRADHITHSGT